MIRTLLLLVLSLLVGIVGFVEFSLGVGLFRGAQCAMFPGSIGFCVAFGGLTAVLSAIVVGTSPLERLERGESNAALITRDCWQKACWTVLQWVGVVLLIAGAALPLAGVLPLTSPLFLAEGQGCLLLAITMGTMTLATFLILMPEPAAGMN